MANKFDINLTMTVSSKDDPEFKTTLALQYENMSESTMMQAQALIVEPLAKSLIGAGFERIEQKSGNGQGGRSDHAPGVIR